MTKFSSIESEKLCVKLFGLDSSLALVIANCHNFIGKTLSCFQKMIFYSSQQANCLTSLQVYGTIYHMIHGNPFNLKALVDKWPDFNTVVVRPQEQEMADDLDYNTNTYQIYSKDSPELSGIPGLLRRH